MFYALLYSIQLHFAADRKKPARLHPVHTTYMRLIVLIEAVKFSDPPPIAVRSIHRSVPRLMCALPDNGGC